VCGKESGREERRWSGGERVGGHEIGCVTECVVALCGGWGDIVEEELRKER
jgi:hypothetical protein